MKEIQEIAISFARKRHLCILFFCLIAILFNACRAKKATTRIDQKGPSMAEVDPPPFFFLENQTWRQSSRDSLYEFYGEIDLSPSGFSLNSLGEFVWSEPAQVFVAEGDLTVFDVELREKFTNETIAVDQLVCDSKEPIATISNGFSIIIVNLETEEVLKRYPLSGPCMHLQQLENDQVLALVEGDEENCLRYFFKSGELAKIDSFPIKESRRWLSFSPDLSHAAYLEGRDLVVENLGENSTRKIPMGNDFTTPLFSGDGRRIILTQLAYHRTQKGKILVFDFPSFNPIYVGEFSGHRVVSLQNDRLVIGDELGQIEVVDIGSGEIIYQADRSEIFDLGISTDDRLLFSEKDGFSINYRSVAIESGETMSQSSSNADFIVPKVIANNSKDFYFHFNDRVHVLDLATMKIKQIPADVRQFYEARINADDSKIAFKNYDVRKIGLLDLTTYEVEYFHTADVTYFFGSRPEELVVCTADSSAVFNISTKTWSQSIERINDPQFLTVQQMMAWKQNGREEELVFQIGHSWRNDNAVMHLNTRTFEINERVPDIHELSGNLIGLDSDNNYYLIQANKKLYKYDQASLAKIDSIPGEFYRFYAQVHSTPKREALTFQFRDRYLVFSPNEQDRYQFLKNHDFIWVSPNLEYLVQTRADKIRVYRWIKD